MQLVFSKVITNNKHANKKEYLKVEKEIVKLVTNKKLLHKKNGKPYINSKNIHISISNNNNIIIVAFNKKPVGVDIQRIHKYTSVNNIILISMKEALFKACDISWDIINKLNIISNKINIIKINDNIYYLNTKILNNYVFSICYKY